MKNKLFFFLFVIVASVGTMYAGSFVGFNANGDLGSQIYSNNLIQNKVNVTLVETDTDNHKYSINLVNGGEGSFTMGGVTFSYTNTEAGKTAYKTYNTYIQPNGVNREIRIPTQSGETIKVVLTEACAGILVNGISQDFVAGDNILTATGSSIVLQNSSAKPKISAILSLSDDIIPDTIHVNGTCGENLTWTLDKSNGILTISGIGSMTNYNYYSGESSAPWISLRTYIQSVIISSNITSIGNYAFYFCINLSSVIISNDVTNIGNNAFYGCSGLTSVTIPNSVTSIGSYAFAYCSGLTSIIIGNGVQSVGNGAFSACSALTSVTIPNSVTSIGSYAFAYNSGLTSVTIPNSVTSIGSEAFYGCEYLTKVHISDLEAWCNITFEGIHANPLFYAKHLYLNGSEITDLVIPSGVVNIGTYAFEYCSGLTSVIIPNSVTSIGEYAFYGCDGLTDVTIPNSVTSIGSEAFAYNSGITSITIGNGVKSIGHGAFYDCSGLTSVIIPNSVTSIGEYAFYGCDGLTDVTIPSSVTEIGNNAFDACSRLISITLESSSPITIFSSEYDNSRLKINSHATIYIPCGSMETYKNTPCWFRSASQLQYAPFTFVLNAINGYVSIPKDATMCDEIVEVTAVPDRGCYFVRWGDGATDNPRAIELPQDTLEAIFDYLLTGKCGQDSALTWTFDPSNMALTISGNGALTENYTYGTFIESLIVEDGVTSIGQSAFAGGYYGSLSPLKTVVLSSSVKVLEMAAFAYCSSIESFTCYSQRPPTVNLDALYGIDYSTIVYVPAEYLETYKMHDAWGLYDVRPIENSEAIKDVFVNGDASTFKYFNNGHMFIQRGDKVYTPQGQQVK